jgi:CrcB protein
VIAAVVIVAGIAGALIRFAVGKAFPRPRGVPIAVLIVNVVGSAIGGAVLGLATTGVVSSDLRLVLLTGFCGGLTTFSTFSVETIQLVMDGKWRPALLSVAANLVLGIAAAAIAYALVTG